MKYDIIIIGAGSGGLNIASFMNKVGFKTLLIDKSDQSIGGDCLNYGCVPSKALIHVSRILHNAKESINFGLKVDGKASMKKVKEYIKGKQEIIRKHENASYFKELGMDVELGEAKFVSNNSIIINGIIHEAKRIVIATGSRPRKLNVPGIERVKYLTNETIFEVEELPKRLLIIGAGPIGIEISQAYSRLGSEVTIIERGSKFLPKESPEIAQALYRQFQIEGIKVHFNSEMKEFTSPNTLIVKIDEGEKEIQFDAVLVSVGRELNIEGLNLEKAGIQVDGGRIKVDKYLRTTNKNVFLCGDVAGGFQFTHAAELHAGVIINNFFSPLKKKISYDHLAWVTYTDPEIATFGLNEDELQKRNINYEKIETDFKEDDRAIVDDFKDGKSILYISKNKILGGSMIAPHAGELMQELILANSAGIPIKKIFNKVYPYPTASRINKRVISNHFSKKLTPSAKKIFRWLY